jgi:hypothetical protein
MLENTICTDRCPDRYIPDLTIKACQRCPFDCLTCDSTGHCLTCSQLDFRTFSSAASRCNPINGYYENYTQVC